MDKACDLLGTAEHREHDDLHAVVEQLLDLLRGAGIESVDAGEQLRLRERCAESRERLAPARPLLSSCDHQGAHMKVVTVRDFRDHATEMFRSEDVILVTREGTPAGFFLPWDTPELPVEVRREVFLRLSEQVGEQLASKGVGESEVLDDFATSRRRS
jgi:hypothetical protein